MVQELIHQNNHLEIGSKFNKKVSETVQDVLEGLQELMSKNEQEDGGQLKNSAEYGAVTMFQSLEMRYAINAKTGRPELVDIGLSCFPHDENPRESKMSSNKDALINLRY